jgi:LysM repeat protein
MAEFIGPKEKLTVSQAAARRKKLALAQRQADLAKATAKAPVPKGSTPAGRMQADLARAKANAPVPKSATTAAKTAAKAGTKAKVARVVTGAAKFAAKKSVIGTVALAAGGALANKLNKDASKGKPATGNQNVTTGRGGRPQGFIKDKPKGPNFSTASKPPISKEKPKDRIPSGKYRVETGDTLSGIAKKAGVTLAELRSANPQIKDPRKIFRNTGVTIPKGKTAAGGYTGPVPYRPGSKAAADYEASRKKK